MQEFRFARGRAVQRRRSGGAGRDTQAGRPVVSNRSTYTLMVSWAPSYDWQAVPAGVRVPPGLDVKMELGGGNRARIPSTWQLKLWLPAPLERFFRLNVQRYTTIADIQSKLNEETRSRDPERLYELVCQTSAGTTLTRAPHQTTHTATTSSLGLQPILAYDVEEAELFDLQLARGLSVTSRPCMARAPEAGAAGDGWEAALDRDLARVASNTSQESDSSTVTTHHAHAQVCCSDLL